MGFYREKQQRSMTELDGGEENQGSVGFRANGAAQTTKQSPIDNDQLQ